MTNAIDYPSFKLAVDDPKRRRELLFRNERPFFVLLSQQFARSEIEAICDTATAIRRLDRVYSGRQYLRGLMHGQRVMNLFAQPSTRTAESFIAAAEKLGASSRLISDIRSSSLAKGESVEDSVRVFSSFFDIIVVRHPDEEFALRASWGLACSGRTIPVISAGSGKSQHVTQSLLDVYTLRYSWADRGGIDGKCIVVVGDVARNRAARSLAYTLATFGIGRIHFVAPKAFLPDAELLSYLEEKGIRVSVHERLSDVVELLGRSIDAIYMTRLQQEWDDASTSNAKKLGTEDAFVLRSEFRSQIDERCVIMHPLPRVNELPDDWEDHHGFVVWRQVRNGMWIRAALFAAVIGADVEIRARATRLGLLSDS